MWLLIITSLFYLLYKCVIFCRMGGYYIVLSFTYTL
nr:MAG TPA: hypothetical protein [Caudoviricetes sp.]